MLSALAALVLGLAVVADHARTTLFDADSFAGHAAAILQDDHVRALVAEGVTDQVVLPRDGDLLAARPLIEGVVAGVIGSPPFRSVFEAGVRDVHRAVFSRDQSTVTLTLADVGTVAAEAVRAVRPKLAARIDGRDVELLRRHVGSVTASLARTADRVKALALILLLAGLALAAAALAVAPDRRRAVFRLAVGGIVAGTAIAVVCIVARPIVLGTVAEGDPRAAAGAVWDELVGGLVRKGWLLALAGAVIAAAAASVLRPVGLGEVLRERAPALLHEP